MRHWASTMTRVHRHASSAVCTPWRLAKFSLLTCLIFFYRLKRTTVIPDVRRLFVVTSCTNPSDRGFATNHNPNHQSSQRAQELYATFESIRTCHGEDAYIVSLDNSLLDESTEREISSLTEEYISLASNRAILMSRTSVNKAVPWLAKIILFLMSTKNLPQTLDFVVGRYRLYQGIPQPSDCGAFYVYHASNHAASTRYVMYHKLSRIHLVSMFFYTLLICYVFNASAEKVVLTWPFCPLRRLHINGLEGLVNGIDYIKE